MKRKNQERYDKAVVNYYTSIPLHKPTRMRGTNVWLIQNEDGSWGGYLSKRDAEIYARRYGGSVRRAYVKVSDVKGKKR